MKRVHYNVTGLVNEQMRNDIKNSLDKVNGVQIVNIDFGRSTIEVGCDESLSEDRIKESIEHAGCIIK